MLEVEATLQSGEVVPFQRRVRRRHGRAQGPALAHLGRLGFDRAIPERVTAARRINRLKRFGQIKAIVAREKRFGIPVGSLEIAAAKPTEDHARRQNPEFAHRRAMT